MKDYAKGRVRTERRRLLYVRAVGGWCRVGETLAMTGASFKWEQKCVEACIREAVVDALAEDRERIIKMIKREWNLPPVLMESTLKKIEDPTRRKK